MFKISTAIGVALACLLALGSETAWAQVRLCLELQAPPEQADSLRKLTEDELAHHPSHRLVQKDCATSLRIDYYKVEGIAYLTVRAGEEIPVRYAIREPDRLAERLRQSLAMVLHNEPVFLAKDITRLSAIQRAKHSILVKGNNTYRLELYEDLCFLGSRGVANATGGAISMNRGADGWSVLARIFAGGQPGGRAEEETVIRVLAGAEAGLVWETSPQASASFYLQAGAGVRYMRFVGPDPRDHTRQAVLDQALATINTRLGVRLLRLYDFDMDLFAAAHLPLHLSGNEESPLFGESGRYTPSLQIGLGVGF